MDEVEYKLYDLLYVSGPVWDEANGDRTHRVRLTTLHTEDIGALSWVLGSWRGPMLAEGYAKGWLIAFLYGEDNGSGYDYGKPEVAGFIPEGVKIETTEDVLSYVELRRWETHGTNLRWGYDGEDED